MRSTRGIAIGGALGVLSSVFAQNGAARAAPSLRAPAPPMHAARRMPASSTLNVLWAFGGTGDGATPVSGLIADAAGNLYGTTRQGGLAGGGTVFELSPPASGGSVWTERILHSFGSPYGSGADGSSPWGGLVADKNGSLYGTTQNGGTAGVFNAAGTIYELDPPVAPRTSWTETVLYAFTGGSDGGGPVDTLAIDSHGVLYGTTPYSESNHAGPATVFALTGPPSGRSTWQLTTIGKAGFLTSAPVLDPAGNVYGLDNAYGAFGAGVAFRLVQSSNGDGNWTKSILHVFGGTGLDGRVPIGGTWLSGTLYGVTEEGGLGAGTVSNGGNGTIFALNRWTGTWTENVLYSFTGSNGDGATPLAGPIANAAGQLFGTTAGGGPPNGCPGCTIGGTVYELTYHGAQGWRESLLHEFAGSEGASPEGSLLLDARGRLYGTTAVAGPNGGGTVFELTP